MFKIILSKAILCLFSFIFTFPITPVPNAGFISAPITNPIYKKILDLLKPESKIEQVVTPSGKFVYVSGFPIGFSIEGAGAVVVEKSAVITNDGYKMISSESGIEVGDVIISINGVPVVSGETIQEVVNMPENIGKPVLLVVIRNGKELSFSITAEYDIFASSYRLGLWVRDNAVGVGMMTIIQEDGTFASLGHPITDIDTGAIMPVSKGKVYKCSIIGTTKGEKGNPGQLKGLFLKSSSTIGEVKDNTKFGVFGQIDTKDIQKYSYKKLEVAKDEEVKMGEATIVSTIDGTSPKEYKIEIVKTNYKSSSGDKCMVIRIIDNELISLTGGIVQGMSGSPIIQNNKVVGCVTHVFVGDPKKGFANYISTME